MTGKGAIACTAALAAGLFGRYDRIANALIAEADLILVPGCKLGEIATKRYTVPPKGKPVIHIDIDAEEFGRTYQPTIALWGDVRETVRDLGRGARRGGQRHPGAAGGLCRRRGQAHGGVACWRRGAAHFERDPDQRGAHAQRAQRVMPADGILVADGGFAAHWAGLLYDTKQAGRGFVPDRGFASIGYGLPGAIGAALAGKGRPVVSLTGDGGFNMTHRRAGDGAAHGRRLRRRRLQQRGLGLREGAAAPHVRGRRLSVVRPRRDRTMPRSPRPWAAAASASRSPRISPAPSRTASRPRAFPIVIDVVVTRDPAKMLPAVDNRTVQVKKGDRVA